jgi:hypothetical protein
MSVNPPTIVLTLMHPFPVTNLNIIATKPQKNARPIFWRGLN